MPAASPTPPPRPTGLAPVPLTALAERAGAAWDAPDVGDVAVTGLTLASTAVRPGDLFAAVAGSTAHGAAFAGEAVDAGAVAILTDAAGLAMVRADAGAARVPVLLVPHPRRLVGSLAAQVYGHPSSRLDVIGVTGTSGKTTTCYLIEAALAAAGRRAGLIGTVAARIDGQVLPSMLTTPEAPDLQALFAVMVERGCHAVAMEVSSHALALGRVAGTAFAAGAFTNLSQDHLDFHGDMESYFAAKRMLFDGRAQREIVVIDDAYGRRLAADRPAAATVSGCTGTDADWTGTATDGPPGAQRIRIAGPGGFRLTTQLALPGAFNVTNAVTALAGLAAIGVDPAAGAPGLAGVRVPGRMERIDAGQPFVAWVDYAHKPAALAAVLRAARRHATARVIVVIGAGGDRDTGKREAMGRAAAAGAEVVIVTDDNPRTEDPAAIRAQLLAGAQHTPGAEVLEIGDRAEAIRTAVRAARPGDVLVVAGKGHEQGQEIAGHVHPFSDRAELLAALTAAGGAA